MFKPSPGPWTLAGANRTIPIKDANGRTVASVRYGEHDLLDARLIAAAPDLLAALRDLLSAMHPQLIDLEGDMGRDLGDAMDTARAAITKATRP